jgi:hypothetical protein
MSNRFAKLTIVLAGVVLFAPQSSFAQQSGEGNPLRLTASTPLTDSVPDPVPAADSATVGPIGFFQPASNPENSFVDETIPPEIRQALYPQQSISKQINVTTASPQQEPVPQYPETDSQPDKSFPTQLAVHVEPITPPSNLNNFEQVPPTIEPAPQMMRSDRIFADPPANEVEVQTNLERLPRPIDSTNNQTLASLLEESNSQTRSNSATANEKSWTEFGSTGSDEVAATQSSDDFQQLLQRIATSTCVVLFLGVGFIVVAKRWVGGRHSRAAAGSRSKTKSSDSPRIRVVDTLKLNAKSHLQLVEVGDQRILVASDVDGIKSVTPLQNSFTSALASYDNQNESDSEFESSSAGTYTPAARTTDDRNATVNMKNGNQDKQSSTAEIEAEMKRQLAELLGGQAFKDVFYQQTRAIA